MISISKLMQEIESYVIQDTAVIAAFLFGSCARRRHPAHSARIIEKRQVDLQALLKDLDRQERLLSSF